MSQKFALIIGNTEYTDSGLSQLSAPGKDAEDFARVLNDKEIGAFDGVKVLLNQISSTVIEAIDEFFDQKKPDDLLVLYFSGHGIRDEIGSLYLAFKNTIRSRLRSTAIKSDYIKEAMDQSRSKRQVLILDCCNSGAFPQGTKAELGGVMGMTKAFQGYGRFILTASDATQFAWEGDQVIGETDNSLFTHYLISGLEGEADSNGDGTITVDELYEYAYHQVSIATPKQTPTKFSSKVEGEIILRQNMRLEDIKPMSLPADLIEESEDIRPYVRETAVHKLEKILKGKNIGMARSAIEVLEKIIADENTTRRVTQIATQVLEAFRASEQKSEEERKAKQEEPQEHSEKTEAEQQQVFPKEKEHLTQVKVETEPKSEEAEKSLPAQTKREESEREVAQVKGEPEKVELSAREAAQKMLQERAKREAAKRERDRLKAEQVAAPQVEHKPAEKPEPRVETESHQQNEVLKRFKFARPPWLKFGIIGASIIVFALCGYAATNLFSTILGSASLSPTDFPTEQILRPTSTPEPTSTPLPTPIITDPDLVTPEPVFALPSWTSFNEPHPILSDWRVRRAIAYCTNRIELLESVYPFLNNAEQQNMVAYSFVPRSHWAYPGDESVFVYPYDPEKGKSLLEEAGWSLSSGKSYRTDSSTGSELAITFTTTNAAFRQTWAAVWESQMKDCGIRITRNHITASEWFGDETGLARREFEIGAFAWVGTIDPGGFTLYACDQIPVPDNDWDGQNYMGWCNENASQNIVLANTSVIQSERNTAYRDFQYEFTKDVPSIPLFNRIETYAYTAKLSGFAPTPGEPYYTYNVTDWAISGRDTIVIGFTQEPASFFTLVENSYVGELAESLIHPAQITSLNYDYQPVLLNQLPALENGGTTSIEVEVRAGDPVVDVNGEVVDLAPGTVITNAAGDHVEYTGGAVTMKQLISTFEIIDRLTWEDGTSVSKTDLSLGYKIACDSENGGFTYSYCDKIAEIEFFDIGYTQTWLPGFQDPLFFSYYWPIYPSHQLSKLPVAEWATDPRINETPLSYGPYQLVEWVKGEVMVFEPNLHWPGNTPQTSNLVIQFINAESAEAMLISGEIDILDFTSLFSISNTLEAAKEQGKIKILVNPSATWEHIDFNLFINP